MTGKDRRIAIVVGALFLIALVASIMGGTMIDSILGASDYLAEVSSSETQLLIGALLELVNGFAVVGIAVLLFPILKRQDEGLALGYVALRIIESVIIMAAVIAPLTLIALGQEYATAGAADASYLQAVGGSYLEIRARLVGQFTGIVFSLAAILLYTILYQSRLVPRFISLWGLAAVVLVLAWNLLKLFGIEVSAGMVFGLPIILNELFLALWLIAKGFSSPDAVSKPAAPAISKA